MQRNTYLTWLLTSLLIAGCTDDSAIGTDASKSSAIPANGSETNDPTDKPSEATAPTPDRKSVLADIYKNPIQEGTENQLSDGRYVSYWNGSQFTLNGKKYFVAFSDATPESEIEYPAPEDMVNISQATYELVGNEWKLKSVQEDVGKFGGNNKAPTVNSDHKTVISQVTNGNLMLAVPTFVSAMLGTQLYFYEIFSFSATDSNWKRLGKVGSGYDNSAGCAHEGDSDTTIKCVRNTGIMQFSSGGNSNWPELKVTFTGTDTNKDGNIVTMSEKDSITYRYDEKSSSYQPVN